MQCSTVFRVGRFVPQIKLLSGETGRTAAAWGLQSCTRENKMNFEILPGTGPFRLRSRAYAGKHREQWPQKNYGALVTLLLGLLLDAP
jgi:hypothetical protein